MNIDTSKAKTYNERILGRRSINQTIDYMISVLSTNGKVYKTNLLEMAVAHLKDIYGNRYFLSNQRISEQALMRLEYAGLIKEIKPRQPIILISQLLLNLGEELND